MVVISLDIPTLAVLFFGLTIAGIISEFGKDLYHWKVKRTARKAVKHLHKKMPWKYYNVNKGKEVD